MPKPGGRIRRIHPHFRLPMSTLSQVEDPWMLTSASSSRNPLGNVRMCNHSPLILGNIRETHFNRLIRSRAAREFACAIPSECAECAMAKVCQGNCKAAAEQASGSALALEPFVAAHVTRRAPVRP